MYVIEMTPVRDAHGERRGVVAEGAVGTRLAGRFRIFRYEIRRSRGGTIPDVDEAVECPRRLTDDPDRAWRLLDLVPWVPTPVWGRDELGVGEMWNSNFGDVMADRAYWTRCRVDPAPDRRPGTRLADRARGGATTWRGGSGWPSAQAPAVPTDSTPPC